MEDPDSIWEMPSEAELKTLHARRERANKISSLMGEYLLKGYAMLSSICDTCDSILLRDKEGRNYCVACSEVDTTECAKDDPALSTEAARRRAGESQFLSSPPTTNPTTENVVPSNNNNNNSLADLAADAVADIPTVRSRRSERSIFFTPTTAIGSPTGDALSTAESSVTAKMEWAAQQLHTSLSVESSINLCTLIKSCAETLSALRNLQSSCASAGLTLEAAHTDGDAACTSSTCI